VSETVGQLTLTGTEAQNEAVRSAALKAQTVLGSRIQPITVVFRADMPRRVDGGPSFGYARIGARRILLLDDLEEDGYQPAKTLAHELCHFLDADWLTRSQRVEIMALMTPRPNGWSDEVIAGKRHPYTGEPFECFAVYASAAVFGYRRPAYARLYDRKIAAEQFDAWNLEGRLGFEPRTRGLKVPCSAAELPARIAILIAPSGRRRRSLCRSVGLARVG
jgi:hypothetical protein